MDHGIGWAWLESRPLCVLLYLQPRNTAVIPILTTKHQVHPPTNHNKSHLYLLTVNKTIKLHFNSISPIPNCQTLNPITQSSAPKAEQSGRIRDFSNLNQLSPNFLFPSLFLIFVTFDDDHAVTMNGPLANMNQGGGSAEMGDAQTMAAVKSVCLSASFCPILHIMQLFEKET